METALILEIVRIALDKGVPALLKVISTWSSISDDEVTEADIQALIGKLKDPASYFE